MARLDTLLAPRYEHRVLAWTLVLLHLSLWADFGGALSRSLMLAHLGLFLIWQPLWRHEQQLDWRSTAVFLFATLVFVTWLNWWLMTFWVLLLTGIVGGRVTTRRSERFAYLTALVFLVSELLIACIPPMFAIQSLGEPITLLFGYGLVAVAAGLMFVPAADERAKPARPVDFLYGLTVSLLACILALGSLLSMYLTGAKYPVALFQTVLGIAVFLLAISWLWAPLAGFSGLGQLWERYLQNIGTPFEHWLAGLAELADVQQSPEQFVACAADELAGLPWVAGVRWSVGAERGEIGESSGYPFRHRRDDLELIVFAHRPLGTALMLHGKLLLQLVSHFYRAKEREQELARRAHLQAIYETGARVTHDIKNLLQSMHTLTTAVQASDNPRQERVQEMLRRQLPTLTQRLQLALDKLQAPDSGGVEETHLRAWWATLRARNQDADFEFEDAIDVDPRIPVDLFDSVVENLLENARFKRQIEPELAVRVSVVAGDGVVRLRVHDTGSPVPASVARSLFKAPVHSRTGLGIGLYQASRQAEQLGYTLALRHPDEGGVTFELEGPIRMPAEVVAGGGSG